MAKNREPQMVRRDEAVDRRIQSFDVRDDPANARHFAKIPVLLPAEGLAAMKIISRSATAKGAGVVVNSVSAPVVLRGRVVHKGRVARVEQVLQIAENSASAGHFEIAPLGPIVIEGHNQIVRTGASGSRNLDGRIEPIAALQPGALVHLVNMTDLPDRAAKAELAPIRNGMAAPKAGAGSAVVNFPGGNAVVNSLSENAVVRFLKESAVVNSLNVSELVNSLNDSAVVSSLSHIVIGNNRRGKFLKIHLKNKPKKPSFMRRGFAIA
jgi:hypothetical protein